MVKVTIILSFLTMLIGCIWAAKMCNSCGSECAPACGTRYFRSCCFNYLRKKRGPDNAKWLNPNYNWKADTLQWTTLPVIALAERFWKDLPRDLKLDQQDETPDNVVQTLYV